MGTVVRSDKPNGSKEWEDDDTLTKDALNGDINPILTQVNGNLDDSNIADSAAIDAYNSGNEKITNIQNSCIAAAGTADIDPGKLDQTAGARDGSAGLDADIVQAYAASAAEFNAQTDPGDSGTPDYPEHLEEELERLRYVAMRQSIGANTKLTDGSGSAAWFDGRAFECGLAENPSFLDNNTTPTGWTINGAPATQTIANTLPRAEGWGQYLNLADAAGATSDGIEQTLSGLRDSQIYLVVARVLPNTANVTLITTGALAASAWDDLDIDSSGTSWQTLAGLIKTDAAGTDIVIELQPDNSNYDFGVSYFNIFPITQDDLYNRCVDNVQFAQDTTNTAWADVASATELSVIAPGDGYVIEVDAHVTVNAASSTARVDIEENTVDKASAQRSDDSGAAYGQVSVCYVNTSPTPGTVYTYRINGSGGAAYVSGTIGSTLRVRLTKT